MLTLLDAATMVIGWPRPDGLSLALQMETYDDPLAIRWLIESTGIVVFERLRFPDGWDEDWLMALLDARAAHLMAMPPAPAPLTVAEILGRPALSRSN